MWQSREQYKLCCGFALDRALVSPTVHLLYYKAPHWDSYKRVQGIQLSVP